jgi:hypothetical protein
MRGTNAKPLPALDWSPLTAAIPQAAELQSRDGECYAARVAMVAECLPFRNGVELLERIALVGPLLQKSGASADATFARYTDRPKDIAIGLLADDVYSAAPPEPAQGSGSSHSIWLSDCHAALALVIVRLPDGMECTLVETECLYDTSSRHQRAGAGWLAVGDVDLALSHAIFRATVNQDWYDANLGRHAVLLGLLGASHAARETDTLRDTWSRLRGAGVTLANDQCLAWEITALQVEARMALSLANSRLEMSSTQTDIDEQLRVGHAGTRILSRIATLRPTLLARMGLPPASGSDGKVLVQPADVETPLRSPLCLGTAVFAGVRRPESHGDRSCPASA